MVLSLAMAFSFVRDFFSGFGDIILGVAMALLPVVALFVVAQIFFLHYRKKRLQTIIKGALVTILGLILFLQGVHGGYYPMAQAMGLFLGSMEHLWWLVPIGFLLGLSTTLADPSIYVLAQQTEKATGGAIRRKLLFITLCAGVGLAIVISMLKLMFDISILWIIIPGYLICMVLAYFVEPDFTALAFDSGSVVTGTMIASFILPLITGIAIALDRDPLTDGFGIVGVVALTPILTMLLLGLLLKRRAAKK